MYLYFQCMHQFLVIKRRRATLYHPGIVCVSPILRFHRSLHSTSYYMQYLQQPLWFSVHKRFVPISAPFNHCDPFQDSLSSLQYTVFAKNKVPAAAILWTPLSMYWPSLQHTGPSWDVGCAPPCPLVTYPCPCRDLEDCWWPEIARRRT